MRSRPQLAVVISSRRPDFSSVCRIRSLHDYNTNLDAFRMADNSLEESRNGSGDGKRKSMESESQGGRGTRVKRNRYVSIAWWARCACLQEWVLC